MRNLMEERFWWPIIIVGRNTENSCLTDVTADDYQGLGNKQKGTREEEGFEHVQQPVSYQTNAPCLTLDTGNMLRF